ncbi:MAG: ATP-binding protein [Phycisphaerae bacterium]|jgi:hypothetical protein|nr:ATP-binding protein [Phycisphaerae bacterium]
MESHLHRCAQDLEDAVAERTRELQREVADRKRAEKRLGESEQRNRAWIEYSPVCTKIVDLDFNLQFMSRAGVEGLGIDNITRFYGKPYPFDFYPESFRNTMTRNLERTRKTGEIITQEASVADVDGSELWFHSTLVPVNNEAGQIDYIMVISVDTTDRKRVEETLRREAELRKALLDDLPCAAMILRKGTREIVFSNKKARTMFGAVPGEICYETCAERDDPCPWCLAPEVWATNESRRFEPEYRGRFYEGIWLPYDDETYIHYIFDITDRKHAEEELAKHRDHLEKLVKDRTAEIEAQREQVLEASRLKSEFLATMSHELRTPLNSIMALSQLMLSAGTGEDLAKDAEFLSVIERNGRNLLNLINDILDLSTIEAGKIRISPGEFAFSEMVNRVLAIARPMAEAKALRFEVDLADIPIVYSDRERIKQILLNLIGNAVKFTEAGQIAVTASESGGMISIAVADTGIGISPDVLPHVFDSFRQADGSNTRKYEGTGLGLAISQQLAGLLGGQITVTSELGKGSTFTVRLPVRMADAGQAAGDATGATDAGPVRSAADRAPETNSGAILVVEDNADNLLATVAILDSLGYECVTALNGGLAVAAAKTHVPALVLMDIQLPVMDGLEAARQIKADAILKDIPIVALTAKAMKGDREEILAAGCDDYLSKPIDPESLRQVLSKWLN